MGVTVWRLAPPHLGIVLDIGHSDGYSYFKQMFEYMAILTRCQLLSEYCHAGKILLNFYYDIRSGIVNKGGHIRMNDYKEKIIGLLNKLSASQIEFLYHFATKLFGHAPD